MKILMTGGTGLVGQAVGQKLTELGHEVVVVSRSKQKAHETLSYLAEVVECDLNTTPLPKTSFNGVDAIINLIGETIDGRWTASKKASILDSRVKASENLLENCPSAVKTILTASAQGFYGDRADEELTEDSSAGSDFLADVCQQWENVFKNKFKNQTQQRLLILRFGLVLSRKGGVLHKLVHLFQKNLGAVLGHGRQWMSYISLNDLVALIVEGLDNPEYSGVINAVNGHPVTNEVFTKVLARQLRVLQLPAVPQLVLKAVMGEMSALVLSSTHVRSKKLMQHKFRFNDVSLEDYLKTELEIYRRGESIYLTEQFVPAPIESVFAFFSEAHNLERITPDFLNFRIVKMSTEQIQKGSLIDYKLKVHGVPISWRTHIDSWNPPYTFSDTQTKGPYKLWHHTHKFKSVRGGTLMTDEVRYKLPLKTLGSLVAGSFVESDIQAIFDYRRKVIAQTNFKKD